MSEPVLSVPEALPELVDPRVARIYEEQRTVWNCTGTVWFTHKPSDGRNTLHGMPDPRGVPDIRDCRVRVECSGLDDRGWVAVEPRDSFAPEEISEDYLFSLGGGRRYRVSLRYRSNSVKNSYLNFDLRARGEPKLLPQEEEEMRATQAASPPAATLPASEVDGLLRLGADPVAALLGAAISQMDDPMGKLAFALAMDRAAASERLRLETGARDERMFQMMLGTMSSAAKGGGSELAAYLRAQQETDRQRLAKLEADAAELREERHKMELANAQGSHAPNPLFPLLVAAGERVLTAGVVKAVEQSGPEGAAKLVGLAAAAVGGGAAS